MLIIESKTFYDAIKPLVTLNYFVGLCAFQLPNQSNFTYIFRRLYAVVITIIYWVTLYINWTFLKKIEESGNTMILTIQKALLFAGSSFTTMAPILVWLRSEGLGNCLREMSILDKAFQVVRGFPNEYRKRYIIMICRVIAILLFTVFACMCNVIASIRVSIQMEIQSTLMFCMSAFATHYHLLLTLVLDLNFCTFVGYLGQKFRDMNGSLLRLANKSSTSCRGQALFIISQDVRSTPRNRVKDTGTDDLMNDKHYLLRETRKAHLKLLKLAGKSNRIFGLQNLLSMGISFTMITGSLYTIYGVFSREKLTNVKLSGLIGTGIWTVVHIFQIWIVNHSCWSASSEAEKTGEIIYELLDSKVDRKLQKEIQEFGVQMLQNPVRFNACGFFTLDYTFVQGVIASVTTYLIILIQMSPKSESSIFDAAFAGNNTGVSAN